MFEKVLNILTIKSNDELEVKRIRDFLSKEDDKKSIISLNSILPIPEGLNNQETLATTRTLQVENRAKYGAIDAKDWCTKNWGTFSDVTSKKVLAPNKVAFISWGSSVRRLMHILSQNFPKTELMLEWAQEGEFYANVGYGIWLNGKEESITIFDTTLLAQRIWREYKEA